MARPSLTDRLDQFVFNAIYSRNLVYNTCWEDPSGGPTGAGTGIRRYGAGHFERGLQRARLCIAWPQASLRRRYPRQTALLSLQIAAIRHLDHDDFFAILSVYSARNPGW